MQVHTNGSGHSTDGTGSDRKIGLIGLQIHVVIDSLKDYSFLVQDYTALNVELIRVL